MSKEKPIILYEYFQQEIKQLLNPAGANKPQAVATKIAAIIMGFKRKGNGNLEDLEDIREKMYEKWTIYKDNELSLWYGDLKSLYEEDTQKKVDKVIHFYIQKLNMTEEEKILYKEYQQKQRK